MEVTMPVSVPSTNESLSPAGRFLATASSIFSQT